VLLNESLSVASRYLDVTFSLRKVELYEVWMRVREGGFETSFGRTVERPGIIVKVEEEGGEVGYGEVVAGEGPWYSCETYETAWHVIKEFIAPMLRRSTSLHDLIREFSRIRGHNMAKAGVEEAIWDLVCRLESRPLWACIGGVRNRIESGVSIGIQDSVKTLLSIIKHYLDVGYRRIKVKIKPGWDVNVVDAIRREYPDIKLQVDANAAYRLSDYPVLKELDRYDLLMIEQPLHYRDLVDHAKLARMLRTPICLDESVEDSEDARKAYELDSALIINIKPGRVGGILESLRIHDLWFSRFHRPVWIGGMLETGIGRGILVSLATLPGVLYPNDISASDRYYDEDIVDEPWTLNPDGTISVRGRPGIGAEPDWNRLRRYLKRSAELSLRD
jgi:O-succinylbenzoate synthase